MLELARPLAVPGPAPNESGRSAAVELFADRGDPDCALDGTTAPVVGQVVARLDGMPLAIARVDAVGLSQLLDRLDDRFALLASRARTAPRPAAVPRDHCGLELSAAQRPGKHVFRQLAIFCDPSGLDAAETLAGAAAGPAVLKLAGCSLLVSPDRARWPGSVPDAGNVARSAWTGWPRLVTARRRGVASAAHAGGSRTSRGGHGGRQHRGAGRRLA